MAGYALSEDTASEDTAVRADVIRLRGEMEDLLRRWVLEAVESVLEAELGQARRRRCGACPDTPDRVRCVHSVRDQGAESQA